MAEPPKFFTDGEAYERLMGRWSRAAGEVFIEWLSLGPGLDWLDVGCGTGAFSELILSRCSPKRICGVDPAEDQVAFARGRPVATRVDYRVGDAQSLPFGNAEFDVAAMALVITFVPDPAKGVVEMARVVRPGGSVATYIWDFFGNGFSQQPLREAVEAMEVSVPLQPSHGNSRPEKLRSIFEAAGLVDLQSRSIDIQISYSNFDEYWSTETKLPNFVVAPIRKMSAPDVERLKDYLRSHLPMDEHGRIAYPARMNAIKGRLPH